MEYIVFFFIFVFGCYNGKYFKCETFIKISSKQMEDSMTVHSFKKHTLFNVSYGCYGLFLTKSQI